MSDSPRNVEDECAILNHCYSPTLGNSVGHEIELIETDGIMKIQKNKMKKKDGTYRFEDNILCIKAVPGLNRVSFKSTKKINCIDKIDVYMKTFDLNKENPERLQIDGIYSSHNNCNCFNNHNRSGFCITSRSADIKIEWNDQSNASANSSKTDFINLDFGLWPTVNRERIYQLVFDHHVLNKIERQVFYVKTVTALNRDFKKFKESIKKGDIEEPQEPVAKRQKVMQEAKKMFLNVDSTDVEDYEGFENEILNIWTENPNSIRLYQNLFLDMNSDSGNE